MAADGISPAIAIRSSGGVELWHSANGRTGQYTPNEQFQRDESKFCRAIQFSPDGRYLAWANGSKVQVASVDNWQPIYSLPRPKAFAIKFSPKGNYLVTAENILATKDGAEPGPNVFVYRVSTGEEVYSVVNKKYAEETQSSWSSDETLFAILVGGEGLFFETQGEDGFTKPVRRIGGLRGGELSVAGAGANPHVSLYVPGAKGAPSVCKIHRYPALDQNQVVSSKSFFQADRVEMHWNKRASGMLLMTIMDVDSTGASYYGKQSLHYLNTKGDACSVPLSKEGVIHAMQWNPKGNEFCIIYGYMPSKATIYNLKCDPIFEVGEGLRNSIYYNDFGNIVLLAGFGNLRGNVEVWNSAERKLITTLQAPDTTMLEWCPDGEHFITATTTPRLRIANGFKVWHYSGALLHETAWPAGQELYEVLCQKYPEGVCTEKPISNQKVEGIQPAAPQASKSVYVPPGARAGGLLSSVNSPAAERSPIPGLPFGYKVSQSQTKKARKAKRENVNGSENTPKQTNKQRTPIPNNQNQVSNNENAVAENGQNDVDGAKNKQRERRVRGKNSRSEAPTTGDPEKDKRARTILKKLHDISTLRARKEKGEFLEANQLSKIDLEAELTKELNSLKIVA